MSFPDDHYLEKLIEKGSKRLQAHTKPEQLLAFSGVFLDSTAQLVFLKNATWVLKTLPITDEIILTATNPALNALVITQCERKPSRLREVLQRDQKARELVQGITMNNLPILVMQREEGVRVFDGMHRLIAAIRDGAETIGAYVGTLQGEIQPECEAHLIYDLIKPYQWGLHRDREGLVTALRLIKKSYVNAEELMRVRFAPPYLDDPEIMDILKEALASSS